LQLCLFWEYRAPFGGAGRVGVEEVTFWILLGCEVVGYGVAWIGDDCRIALVDWCPGVLDKIDSIMATF
jgi:hypothetical protein